MITITLKLTEDQISILLEIMDKAANEFDNNQSKEDSRANELDKISSQIENQIYGNKKTNI